MTDRPSVDRSGESSLASEGTCNYEDVERIDVFRPACRNVSHQQQ